MRELTKEYGILLIFDEVKTGFRIARGGAAEFFGIKPDLASFAKAIGNGHPMAAIIGTRQAMAGAHESFISSTYWTEGVGSAAALATMNLGILLENTGRAGSLTGPNRSPARPPG